jgi:hypothetical protein
MSRSTAHALYFAAAGRGKALGLPFFIAEVWDFANFEDRAEG